MKLRIVEVTRQYVSEPTFIVRYVIQRKRWFHFWANVNNYNRDLPFWYGTLEEAKTVRDKIMKYGMNLSSERVVE